MTANEVLKLVKDATGVDVAELKGKGLGLQTHARYCAIVIMHEEGIKCHQIADFLGVHRVLPFRALERIKVLLEDKSNCSRSNEFKWLYLKCIAKIAEMEDAA